MKKKHNSLETHLRKLSEQDITCRNLESVYELQKQKLDRYMASVVTTFPAYSAHDTVHSTNIISAMERIWERNVSAP